MVLTLIILTKIIINIFFFFTVKCIKKFLFAFTGLDWFIIHRIWRMTEEIFIWFLIFEKWKIDVQGIFPLWWWKILQINPRKKESNTELRGDDLFVVPHPGVWNEPSILWPWKKWTNFAAHGRREPL